MDTTIAAARPDFISDDLTERFTIKWGLWAVLKLCADSSVKTVLDVGCGAGEHTRLLRHFGKEVFTNDWKTDCDYPGDILDIDFGRQFDAVLCSHVLEHQRNAGLFLDKLISLVHDNGAISIAVPRHQARGIVLGHLTVWSAHLLAYNLVQSGVNCQAAQCLEDNECTVYAHKAMFNKNSFQEKQWHAGSGKAYSDDTTFPWHDDIEILSALMPVGSMAADWASKNAYNWDGHMMFPLPDSSKDIEILTGKQAEPVRLLYSAIAAMAESAVI